MTPAPKKNSATPKKRRARPLGERHIIGFLFSIGFLLTLFLGFLLFSLDYLHIPDVSSVANYRPLQTTLVYDRHGVIIDRHFIENRQVVPLSRMQPLVPKAFVAAEDGRFFEHPGLDIYSVFRALINNIRDGRKAQGGSTITQQIAKGLLLTPEKTYLRKFKEAILAWRIDSLLSKDEIIYIYLNQIYLGNGAYGIEAAAQTYFGKSAATLDLAEIALLAGLPQAPSRYSPTEHWEQAKARQRYVLNRMAADGYISHKQAQQAYEARIELAASGRQTERINGYFLQEVAKRAEQMLGAPLKTVGVRIYTNLDQRLQTQAEEAVSKGLQAAAARRVLQTKQRAGEPQGALVCLEACSGKVRALVGGSDFSKTPFNRAVQAKRPAGSVFKPLIYSAALERGLSAETIIVDEPLTVAGSDGKPWRPKNFSGSYHGPTSLHNALVHSYNIPAIKVMQRVGVKPVHDLARAAGITADLPPDLSLALGAVDVSLLEMSAAYQPFVCKGVFVEPSLIARITDGSGKELYRARPISRQVMSERTATGIKNMLVQAVSSGTGRKAGGLPGLSGGKTGTSDDNRDAWFIGFHDRLIGGIWIGFDRNQGLGEGENGGQTAAPIWRSFMAAAGAGT